MDDDKNEKSNENGSFMHNINKRLVLVTCQRTFQLKFGYETHGTQITNQMDLRIGFYEIDKRKLWAAHFSARQLLL